MSAFAGDTAAAGTTVSSIATEAWPPELRLSSMNGLGLLAEAYICLDSLDFAGAEDILRDTQTYLRITEYWPLLTTARLLAKLGLGQGQAEAERITRELAVTPAPPGAGDNTATEHLYAVLAAAWMASGDHREAGRILADKPEDSPHLAAARVSWLLGAQRDREAIQQGIALLDLPGHTIRTRAETQTMAAVAALREGESELAWLWLSAAAVAWESYGARMHIALMDPEIAGCCGSSRASKSPRAYGVTSTVRSLAFPQSVWSPRR